MFWESALWNRYLYLSFVVSCKKLNILFASFFLIFDRFQFVLQILTVKFHLTVILIDFILTFAFFLSLSSHFWSWISYPFWYYSILRMMTFTKYYVSAANWLMILPLSSVYNFCLSRNEQYYELAHQYQGNSQVSFWFLEELSWFVQEKWEIQWTLTWINYLIIIIQIISKHTIIYHSLSLS